MTRPSTERDLIHGGRGDPPATRRFVAELATATIEEVAAYQASTVRRPRSRRS